MLYSAFILDCIFLLKRNPSLQNLKIIRSLQAELFTIYSKKNVRRSIDVRSWGLTPTIKKSLLEKQKSVRKQRSKHDLYLTPYTRYFETIICLKLLKFPLPNMMAIVKKISFSIVRVLNDIHLYLNKADLAVFLDRISKQHFAPGRLPFKPRLENVISILTDNKCSDFYKIMNIHLLFADVCLRNFCKYPDWMQVVRVNSSSLHKKYDDKNKVCALINKYLYQSDLFKDRGRIHKVRDKYREPIDLNLNENNAFSALQGIALEYIDDLPVADHIWRQDRFYTDPDFTSAYVASTLGRGLPYVAGPSGLMTLFIPLAMLVGQLNAPKDLFYYILCCCVYLVCGGMHSFYETLITAEDRLRLFTLNGVKFTIDGNWQQSVGEFLKIFSDDALFIEAREGAYDALLEYNSKVKLRKLPSLLKPNRFVKTLSDENLFLLMPEFAMRTFYSYQKAYMLYLDWRLLSNCLTQFRVFTSIFFGEKAVFLKQISQNDHNIINFDYLCKETFIGYIFKVSIASLIRVRKFLIIDELIKLSLVYDFSTTEYGAHQQAVLLELHRRMSIPKMLKNCSIISDQLVWHAMKFIYLANRVIFEIFPSNLDHLSNHFDCYSFKSSTLSSSLEGGLRKYLYKNVKYLGIISFDSLSPRRIIQQYLQLYEIITSFDCPNSNEIVGKVDNFKLKIFVSELLKSALFFSRMLSKNASQFQLFHLGKIMLAITRKIIFILRPYAIENVFGSSVLGGSYGSPEVNELSASEPLTSSSKIGS